MRADLKSRLQALELRAQKQQQQRRWPMVLVTMLRLEDKRKQAMAPDERIVVDWFRDFYGVVWGRERVTNTPGDEGRCCERGGYLPDVIREIHQDCSLRGIDGEGSCMCCADFATDGRLTCIQGDGAIQAA